MPIIDISCRFEETANGLKIVLEQDINSPEVVEALLIHQTEERLGLWDVAERAFCNSCYRIATELPLTEAPAIGEPVYDDEGDTEGENIIGYNPLFYFDNYALEDEIETLLTTGEVFFHKV